MYVWRFVLTNILVLQLGPLKLKFLTPPIYIYDSQKKNVYIGFFFPITISKAQND